MRFECLKQVERKLGCPYKLTSTAVINMLFSYWLSKSKATFLLPCIKLKIIGLQIKIH